MSKVTRIGTITNKAELVRRTSEQTACNFYEITVPKYQTAVLYLDTRGDLSWSYEGTVTNENWVNRLGASSSVCEKRSIGKPMTDWHHAYGYQLLSLMLDGKWNVLLDDGVEVTAEVKNLDGAREVSERMLPHMSSSVFARIVPASCLYSEV